MLRISQVAQTLRMAASDAEAAERALQLALADCASLRRQVANLNAEREAYFKPQVVGHVTVNATRDEARCAVRFRAQIGTVTISGEIDEAVFFEDRWDDVAVRVGRMAAENIAGLVGEKIGPALVQAMKATTLSPHPRKPAGDPATPREMGV